MQPAFLSQTALAPDQERINFTIMDNPVIDLLSSLEAEKVCSKMLLIYTRLKRANWKYYERPGVLLLHGDGRRTAWEILCDLAGVASATLNKAIKWMKEQRVIGYWAGKNNAGIRIFFNVATASIRQRDGQKNLRLVHTSSGSPPTSLNEVAFKDSSAVQNDQDLEKRASREHPAPMANPPDLPSTEQGVSVAPTKPTLQLVPPLPEPSAELRLALLDALARKVGALDRTLQDVARSIPNQAWLENALLPKAIRVALAEVFRQQHGRARPEPKAAADVGGSQPVISEDALSEYEAMVRDEEWAEAALRALPPDEYATRITALEQQAAYDPRYAKIHWADDEAKRSHFEALLKRELLIHNQPMKGTHDRN